MGHVDVMASVEKGVVIIAAEPEGSRGLVGLLEPSA